MADKEIAVDIDRVPGRLVLANACWQCDGLGYLKTTASSGNACGLCRDGYILTAAGEAIRKLFALRWYLHEAPFEVAR